LGRAQSAASRDVAPRRNSAARHAFVTAEHLENRTLLAADPVISEFMASNDKTVVDKDGVYSDWIEIYNRGDAAANLDGWFLTDDSSELTKWRFPAVTVPAGGYLVVFASEKNLTVAGQELHTNFKLDAAGEYLGLVQPDGLTVNHAYAPSYPNQTEDISYGLSNETDPASTVQFLTRPTPGARNDANAPAPTFSVPSKTFTTSFSLILGLPPSAPAGSEIRYTLNRSLPTAASTRYTAPITISNSTIVRAQVYAPGRSPGPVVSQTYVALDTSVQSFNSNLPVVIMDTFGSGLNDTNLTGVSAYFIDTSAADGRAEMLDAPDFAGRGGLRYRGQSSQGFPKAPYAFETWDETNGDKDVSILGMPADSDWILYNPYSEKSLMQNYLAYMWGNRLGEYAVRTRYVELFVNSSATGKVDYAGDYQGIYIFMEKIKPGDDRVDIEKLTPQDNTLPNVTGGYIWKKDKYDGGEVGFSAGAQAYTICEPSEQEITPAQRTYLTGYINEFYSVLMGPNYKDPVNGYAKYIDVDSWIDHHIMVELTKNIDGFRLSTYYHKDRNGKIVMGPIWDYNLSLGNADYATGQTPTGWYHDTLGDDAYPYWRRLFSDPAFAQKYQDRFQQLRKNELSTPRLLGDIDNLVQLLSDGNGNYPVGNSPQQTPNNPVVRNFQRWHVLGVYVWPNGHVDSQGRWIEDVNWMKDWLRTRLAWWDSQYLAMPSISPPGGAVNVPTQVTISSTGGTTTVDTPLLTTGSPAKALVPTADIGTNWRSVLAGFDDSGWLTGATGAGYDDDPSSGGNYNTVLGLDVAAPPGNQTATPMRNAYGSLYVRVPFNVANPAAAQSLILRMQYDDGFVAYLNGTEVARSSNNVPAEPAWDSFGVGSHDASGFEEFDITPFKNLLQPGANLLAIHGINTTLGSSDLLMLPELISRSSTAAPAPVYYTTDGSDPRTPAGAVSPTARLYSGPFTVTSTTRVRARSLLSSKWSGLADELYDFGESRLRVSEIMYNPPPATPGSQYTPGDFEYIELLNTGGAAMDLTGVRFDKGITYAFAPGTTLGAGERIVVARNRTAFQSRYAGAIPLAAGSFTGALSDGGERIRLLGPVGQTIQDFTYDDDWYSQTDGEGFSLTVVDPAAPVDAWGTKQGWRASDARLGTPGGTDNGLRPNSVVINEVMTNSAAARGDWIELRNTTDAPIDIGNWWLSDTRSNLQKFRIAAGTTIPANGYLVFTQSQHFDNAFELSAAGEAVFLSSADAAGNLGGYRLDETFGAADPNVTFGRFVKSTGGADFTALASPTQGAANAAPVVGPVVINEIMYFPPAGKSEYLELRNLTAGAVPLYLAGSPSVTWRLSGGIDFALPSGATIPAGGYAIVSAVDPATFRQQYPNVPAGVPVWGPYTLPDGVNVLSDNGESVRLQKPGVQTGTAPRPFIDVDRVAYDDEEPWPDDTKGTDQSLAKRNSAGYGNDPVNWDAERPGGSAGESNFAPDFTAPTADVVDVTPDPRTTAVATITIRFSERVTGFDLGDLSLTRNGGATNLLTAAQTLTSTDNGLTWTLGNLAGLTLFSGQYDLTLTAAGSRIQDLAHNALASDASDAWAMNNPDASAPTVRINTVAPDPRRTAVTSVSILFSEVVTGMDLSDLTLTRNGGPNLLTAANTLTSSDSGKTYVLAGLSGLTAAEGQYVLTLKSSGTGIADLAGNALVGGAADSWVTDLTAPTMDVVDVTPDPRRDGVDSITIAFSEPVGGFDYGDLLLTIDGGSNNLLTAAQTLASADGGQTWTLGNLGALTGGSGRYRLAVSGDGGITDRVGNLMPAAAAASDDWVVDSVAPVADVLDVAPDPRRSAVDTITILFSEPVVGFNLADFQLSRDGAAGHVGNLLTDAQTLVTVDDGSTWELQNLSGITAGAGTYTLTLVSGVSGISDAIGNSLAADAADSWTVLGAPPATVAGRYAFYNASSFDGGDAAANAADDASVAPDKQALLAGQVAGEANYTGYLRGINGLMIDIAGWSGGVAGRTLSADDFTFRVASDLGAAAWTDAPAPTTIALRGGAGAGGSDRVTLCWPDGAIKNTWLQVTVKANPNTGLAADDVFYFGNLVGDAGGDLRVNALDVAAVKRALGTGSAIDSRLDFNRDGRINALDVAAVKQNLTRTLGTGAAAAPAAASVSVFSADPIASDPLETTPVWSETQTDLLGRA
jgi:hypothetical protein